MKTNKINFKSVWVLAGLLAALLLRPAVLEAAVIAYDPFLNETAANMENDDTNGSYNDSQWRTFANDTHKSCAGGPIVGWTAAELWNQNYLGGGDLISPSGQTGLSLGDKVVQGGHARFRAVSPGGVSYATRDLASYTANNTYYMSALVRQGADALDRWYNLKGMTGFTSSLTTNAYDGTLFSGVLYGFLGNGDSENPRLDLVVRHQDASGAMVNSTLLSGATPGTTYFIVVKIESDVSSGLDRLTAWLNPVGREESNIAAVTTLGNILADTSSITQTGIFSDGLWGVSTVWTDFDEIQFGTEWSDAGVAEIPVMAYYDPFINAVVAYGSNDWENGEYNAGSAPFRDFTHPNNENVVGGPILGWGSSSWAGNSGTSAGTYDVCIGPTDTFGLSFADNIVMGGNVQARGNSTTGIVAYASRDLGIYDVTTNTYYMSGLLRADLNTINNISNSTINAMMGFSSDITTNAFNGSNVPGALFGFHGNGSEVDLAVRYRDETGVTTNATLHNGVTGGITYFVVVKLEYDVEAGGVDRLTAWLNPSSSEGVAVPAFTTTGKMLDTAGEITCGGFWVEKFYSEYLHHLQFDELRCGARADVVAIDSLPVLSIQYDSGILEVGADLLNPTLNSSLQVSTDLTGGSWSNIHTSTGTATTNWVITPLPDDPQSFYRIESN